MHPLPPPLQLWAYKGTFLMHRVLLLEFACFCRLYFAVSVDRFVQVRRSADGAAELVRPEAYARPEAGAGHRNTLERSWGYFFERLLNFWAFNAGYGLVLIHGEGADAAQQAELERRGGRWQVLAPVSEGNLTATQRRLRACQALVCVSLPPEGGDGPRCPHLYD